MSSIGLFQEPTNITELFTFDLSSFFLEEDFEEINSKEDQGVFMIEYEKKLPWLELDLFDRVIFRLYNDKSNVEGSSHINVRFPANQTLINLENTKKLIGLIYKTYGTDDNNQGDWGLADEKSFAKNSLFRVWTLGEGDNMYTVKISQQSQGEFLLEILFFNHLLKLTGN